jgi:hypothetical protein
MTLALLAMVACSNEQKSTTAAGDATAQASRVSVSTMTPEQLGELGAQIRRQPDRAHDLLAQHGLDASTFELQIRRVTEDPQASRRYADAYRRTGGK